VPGPAAGAWAAWAGWTTSSPSRFAPARREESRGAGANLVAMTMTARTVKTIAMAFAGLLILAACGESEVGGERAGFIDRVDELCAQADAQLADLDLTDAAGVAEGAQVLDGFRTEVRGLDPPRAEFEQWRLFLVNVDNLAQSFDALERALGDGDEASVSRRVEDVEAATDGTRRAAETYGLAGCFPE